MPGMICSQCAAEGKTSQIDIGVPEGPAPPKAPFRYFYDEQGKFHVHDDNEDTTQFTCTNGHVWTETNHDEKCWCRKVAA